MDKTLKSQVPRCPKCGNPMDTKRKDAGQCRECRRQQQNEASYKIKKPKRKIISKVKSLNKAKKTGAEKEIKYDILRTLESCIENSKYPTKEEFKFLTDQIIYDFEKISLPKGVQDDYLKKLRETDFKFIFDKMKSSSS